MRRIVTYFWQKPVPSNQFDWSATDDNYECEIESDGHVTHSHPIGYGATEQAAIEEFLSLVDNPEDYECAQVRPVAVGHTAGPAECDASTHAASSGASGPDVNTSQGAISQHS